MNRLIENEIIKEEKKNANKQPTNKKIVKTTKQREEIEHYLFQ